MREARTGRPGSAVPRRARPAGAAARTTGRSAPASTACVELGVVEGLEGHQCRCRASSSRNRLSSRGKTLVPTLCMVPTRRVPLLAGPDGGDVGLGGQQPRHDGPGVHHQRLPDRSQPDPPRAARTLQQRCADRALEAGHLLADRRLRVAEVQGRGAEGARCPPRRAAPPAASCPSWAARQVTENISLLIVSPRNLDCAYGSAKPMMNACSSPTASVRPARAARRPLHRAPRQHGPTGSTSSTAAPAARPSTSSHPRPTVAATRRRPPPDVAPGQARRPARRSPGLITPLISASRSSNGMNADFIALTVNHWKSRRS